MGAEEKKCYNCTWFNKTTSYCNKHHTTVKQHDTCQNHTKK